jgi:hypothetical protein
MAFSTAYTEGNKPNSTFQSKCERIFIWAGYRPHTTFHLNRFPLIGYLNAWKRLKDRLTINVQGRELNEESEKLSEHVLDVIIFDNQTPSSLNLVKTDMYTILFVDSRSPISISDENEWRIKLNKINGSIVCINYESSTDEESSYHLNNISTLTSETLSVMHAIPSRLCPRFEIVRLMNDENIRPNQMDVLSVIFRDIKDVLSEYQEQQVRCVMQKCEALIYNDALKQNDPPDGYYLCNAECLACLKRSFGCAPHTFATIDVFDNESFSDKYILLAVEVKLSFDSFQPKLGVDNYYILQSAPNPIRNLVIVNGGQVTRAWFFLINLAHIGLIGRETGINQRIHARSCEFAQKLHISHTHIVYLPSFSSETFRQELLTRMRLETLHKVVRFEEKLSRCSKSIAGISGLAKGTLEFERNEKKQTYTKNMIKLLDRFMRRYPIQNSRSSINESILLQPNMRDGEHFRFLEQLVLSLLRERQENVSRSNQNVRFPNELVTRARALCTIKITSPVVVIQIKPRAPSVRQASFPNDSETDDDSKLEEETT